MIAKNPPLSEVYVWELPVRIFHWVNAFCITFLIITGVMIAYPPTFVIGEGAQQTGFWFGYLRFTHITLGAILIINFLVRFYWFFAGNKFAKWYNYIPCTRKQWKGIFETVKVDVFLLTPKPIYDIGHNSLAASTYLVVFILIIFQGITGLAMWSPASDVPGSGAFQDLLFATGGFFTIRYLHYIMMWVFILFIIAHIYLVFYHDYIERTGIASSIIGGWKFIDKRIVDSYKEELDAEDELEKTKNKFRKLKRKVREKK